MVGTKRIWKMVRVLPDIVMLPNSSFFLSFWKQDRIFPALKPARYYETHLEISSLSSDRKLAKKSRRRSFCYWNCFGGWVAGMQIAILNKAMKRDRDWQYKLLIWWRKNGWWQNTNVGTLSDGDHTITIPLSPYRSITDIQRWVKHVNKSQVEGWCRKSYRHLWIRWFLSMHEIGCSFVHFSITFET